MAYGVWSMEYVVVDLGGRWGNRLYIALERRLRLRMLYGSVGTKIGYSNCAW